MPAFSHVEGVRGVPVRLLVILLKSPQCITVMALESSTAQHKQGCLLNLAKHVVLYSSRQALAMPGTHAKPHKDLKQVKLTMHSVPSEWLYQQALPAYAAVLAAALLETLEAYYALDCQAHQPPPLLRCSPHWLQQLQMLHLIWMQTDVGRWLGEIQRWWRPGWLRLGGLCRWQQ